MFRYARRRGWLAEDAPDPLAKLRAWAAEDAGRAQPPEPNPIADPVALARVLAAARAAGLPTYVAVLLSVDAGLRTPSEVRGLKWGDVEAGVDADDPGRRLRVRRSWPDGTSAPGPTKGKRARAVPLSRRLRAALLALRREAGEPGADAFVLPAHDGDAFQKRTFPRLLTAAGLGRTSHSPYDGRDTFGSHLVSAGVPLAWVSKALGHRTLDVTARHYAAWAGDGEYREPPRLRPGEVPPDLMARLGGEDAGDAAAPACASEARVARNPLLH